MPRFRTGHRVPLNVYDGDRPIFQAHSAESAAELVELLNIGARSKEFLDAWDMPVGDFLTPPEFPTPSDTPPGAPESPSEPPPATGQPADDSGPQGRATPRSGICVRIVSRDPLVARCGHDLTWLEGDTVKRYGGSACEPCLTGACPHPKNP